MQRQGVSKAVLRFRHTNLPLQVTVSNELKLTYALSPPFSGHPSQGNRRNLSRQFRLTSLAAWLNFDSRGTYSLTKALQVFEI
jgi:hypothetical protein